MHDSLITIKNIRTTETLFSYSGSSLEYADMSGINLDFADLSQQNMCGADLGETSMRFADLSGSNLAMANLSGCDLTGANLSRSTIDGTVFVLSKLVGTNLSEAIIDDVDFQTAEIRDIVLTAATYTSRTQWPDNVDAVRAGATMAHRSIHDTSGFRIPQNALEIVHDFQRTLHAAFGGTAYASSSTTDRTYLRDISLYRMSDEDVLAILPVYLVDVMLEYANNLEDTDLLMLTASFLSVESFLPDGTGQSALMATFFKSFTKEQSLAILAWLSEMRSWLENAFIPELDNAISFWSLRSVGC